MKKKLLMILIGTLLLLAQAKAQQFTVTGKVVSDAGPIVGATIRVKSGAASSTSGKDGKYAIKANKNDVLIFSFIGFGNREITIGENAVIDMVLVENISALNEVIVTGQGITRSRKSLGYSAQVVKGSEIADAQRENFLNSLQGRVAGAVITPTTGAPGASSSIVLRGGVSLDGDNQPLFVVDGLPISNKTFSDYSLVNSGNVNRSNDYGNRAMDINPEDIESVTILKGPEAAALYGTEGASGAVVITTKKAKAGAARVTYSNSFRLEEAYRFPEIQTVYGGGAGGIFDEELKTRTYFGAKYPANLPIYDNVANFYQTGFTQRHNASVEGGTDKLSLRTSLSYTNQSGYLPSTGYRELNLKISGSSKISTKLTLNASINYINSNTDKIYRGASSALLSSLSWPIVDDMRNYLDPVTGGRRTITGSLSGELDNPYWAINKNPNNDKLNRTISNLSLDYTPAKWLSVTARFGADIYTQSGLSAYHPQSYSSNVSATLYSGGGINTYTDAKQLLNGSLIATIKRRFGKFSPIVRIGGDWMNDNDATTAQFGTRFYEPDFYSINNTDPTTQRVLYSNPIRRKMGAFAQAELGYDDLLFLTVTGRQDYSSTLPIENFKFFYPAASLSFVFSDLGVMKKLDWLSLGKLRASYGQSGKDARTPYVTKNSLTAQTSTGGGFSASATAGNPNLEAEFTTSKEAGLELGFFDDRLSFDFSVYENISDKQITAPRLSYATGAVLKYINSGKISSKGFELMIKGSLIRNPGFTWDISGNISKSRGKILSLPAGQDVFYLSDTWITDNARTQYSVGSSLLAISGVDYLRNDAGQILINPSNGMPVKGTDFIPLGDRTPDFTAGLNNSFSYKNFNLSFLLDIKKGGDIYNATEEYLYIRGLSKYSLDRETPRIVKGVLRDGLENTANPTPNNLVITPYISTTYYSTYFTTADFIQKDVNWVRLKDITLRYNFPKRLFAKSNVFKSASVYFTGTDLFMLTNYKGVDPQTNGSNAATGGLGAYGVDYGTAGQPRTYSLGFKVGF
jgi:ferric enterobactin receptor